MSPWKLAKYTGILFIPGSINFAQKCFSAKRTLFRWKQRARSKESQVQWSLVYETHEKRPAKGKNTASFACSIDIIVNFLMCHWVNSGLIFTSYMHNVCADQSWILSCWGIHKRGRKRERGLFGVRVRANKDIVVYYNSKYYIKYARPSVQMQQVIDLKDP